MATSAPARHVSPTTRVVVKVVVYYAVLLGVASVVWRQPAARLALPESIGSLFGGGAVAPRRAAPFASATLAAAVALAMLAAALLSLPVAWVYLLTRAKRGYQQSVVQTFIVLPMVVSGVVVLVKDSLPLAFALAGIVAAVRFRNTLDDSKDAVYIFLATGIGLAAAVDPPGAAAISIVFNATVLALWLTDFGRSPVELEGRSAERRLQRARELARTGTFVARMDEEVFREMTAEQLEGVAERARRRARQHDPEAPGPEGNGADADTEVLLLVRTLDVAGAHGVVEPRLDEHVKRWRFGGATLSSDGSQVMEYAVTLKKSRPPDELLAALRAAGAPQVIEAELE